MMDMDRFNDTELKIIAKNIRKKILKMIFVSQSSHIGTSLSIVDILVLLYFQIMKIDSKNPSDPLRDKFILSKAHGSTALYAILAEIGFFPLSYLDKYYVDDGILPGHLDKDSARGIEYSMGSLGHGLSVGVGMAIANKQTGNYGKIYVLLGDGECNEGSVWEAIMLASHLKLNNIIVVVDYNKIQSFGNTNEVINQEPIVDRWKSFGWDVFEVDGHNFIELYDAFQQSHTKPKVIIAHTVKGKGVSFMENKLEWHYKSPNQEQYDLALDEIDNQI